MMTCSICATERRADVDAALVAGASVRDAAQRFSFPKSVVDRHRRRCLPRTLAANGVTGASVADELHALVNEARRLQAAAERDGDVRAALVAISQLRELLELKLRALEQRRLASPSEAPIICVVYEEDEVRNPQPLDDQLVRELGELCRRTNSQQVLAVAARLALLLKNRPISSDLDDALARAEAGPPSLPEGGNG